MNKLTEVKKHNSLDREIDNVISKLEKLSPNSEEYSITADNLEKLYRAKSYDKNRYITPDTVALVVGNLLGIAIIIWHEKAEVITTKALGFVMKGRV